MVIETREQTFVLNGGNAVRGVVEIGGSKNAALGAMAACLLAPGDDCVLENVPRIGDVEQMARVMRSVGAAVEWTDDHTLRVNAADVSSGTPDRDLVMTLRGSFLVMGALLARLGEASCPPPGGDVIGQRPIDVHLAAFRALGAETTLEADNFRAVASKGLTGSVFFADYPSVLGTQNAMMAAALAKGTTTIVNAATEPEVQSLGRMLRAMGAEIDGEGTQVVTVRGVESLHGASYELIPDRLEAATFVIAGAITGGEVEVRGAMPEHLVSFVAKVRQTGVEVETAPGRLWMRCHGPLRATSIQALPYPGFPTDLQAPIAALLTQAEGTSYVHERVFENRMGYVSELRRMGGDVVNAGGNTAIITGPRRLTGAPVRALDVRAGAACILAGLAAHGKTDIVDIYHVDRGYERIDEKLKALGADIERV